MKGEGQQVHGCQQSGQMLLAMTEIMLKMIYSKHCKTRIFKGLFSRLSQPENLELAS